MRKTLFIILYSSLLCISAAGQSRLVTYIEGDSIKVKMASPRIHPVDTVKVTIIGDVMLHQAQIDNCFARYRAGAGKADANDGSNYDFTPYFARIKDVLTDADICIANMEFTHAGAPFSGYPAFSAPESYSEYVADCGVDVFLTANNHIFDRGGAGARRTLEVYDGMKDRGIRHTGCFASQEALEAGWPLFLECKGLTIALLNFTYGTNVELEAEYPKACGMDKEALASAMKQANERADIVIALPHWGIEYDLQHSDSQEDIAEFLIRHGADAIIGGHPHVVQDVSSVAVFPDKDVPVVYSLGNIISNMSATNTQVGLIATLPIVIYSDGRSCIGTPQYTLTWCSRPGGLTDSHVTIPIEQFIGKRDLWRSPYDYDKMIDTYNRIKITSGIQE